MARGDRVYLGLIQINACSNKEIVIFNDGEKTELFKNTFTYHNAGLTSTDVKTLVVSKFQLVATKRLLFALLHLGSNTGPADAVRAAIMAEQKARK